MHRTRLATFALLLFPLALIYSCDDKIATEPAPVSPAPESLFEWSLNWVDVGLVGKPMLTRIGDGITLPLRGAFDIVKVSPDGEELWRQAYDTDYYTASSDNVYGFVATGRTQFNETRFIESVTGDGTPESRLVLDGAVPSALAVLRAPNSFHAFAQVANADSRERIHCRVMTVQPVAIANEIVFDNDGEAHDFPLRAAADFNGGSILVGYHRPLESVPYSWPFIMSVAGDGELRWTYDHLHSSRDDLNDVIVLENGNIIAVGTSDYGAGDSHAQIVCLNPSGELLWLQEWDYIQDIESATGAVETADGILVAGNTWIDEYSENPFLLLYSQDGELLASRVFDADNFNHRGALTKDYQNNIYATLIEDYGRSITFAKLKQPIFPNM
jgi:outer membrane protein assembly factor BamB